MMGLGAGGRQTLTSAGAPPSQPALDSSDGKSKDHRFSWEIPNIFSFWIGQRIQ